MALLGQTPPPQVLEKRCDREVRVSGKLGEHRRCPWGIEDGQATFYMVLESSKGFQCSVTAPPLQHLAPSLSEPRKGLTTCNGRVGTHLQACEGAISDGV